MKVAVEVLDGWVKKVGPYLYIAGPPQLIQLLAGRCLSKIDASAKSGVNVTTIVFTPCRSKRGSPTIKHARATLRSRMLLQLPDFKKQLVSYVITEDGEVMLELGKDI